MAREISPYRENGNWGGPRDLSVLLSDFVDWGSERLSGGSLVFGLVNQHEIGMTPFVCSSREELAACYRRLEIGDHIWLTSTVDYPPEFCASMGLGLDSKEVVTLVDRLLASGFREFGLLWSGKGGRTWEDKGFEVFDCVSPFDALAGYDLTEASLLWVVWGLDSLSEFPADSTVIRPFQKLGVVPAEDGSVYWPVDNIYYWPSLGHE